MPASPGRLSRPTPWPKPCWSSLLTSCLHQWLHHLTTCQSPRQPSASTCLCPLRPCQLFSPPNSLSTALDPPVSALATTVNVLPEPTLAAVSVFFCFVFVFQCLHGFKCNHHEAGKMDLVQVKKKYFKVLWMDLVQVKKRYLKVLWMWLVSHVWGCGEGGYLVLFLSTKSTVDLFDWNVFCQALMPSQWLILHLMKIADLQAHSATRCELVDRLFSAWNKN